MLGAIAVALSGCVADNPRYLRGYDPYWDGYEPRPGAVYRDEYRPRPIYRDDRPVYGDRYRGPSRYDRVDRQRGDIRRSEERRSEPRQTDRRADVASRRDAAPAAGRGRISEEGTRPRVETPKTLPPAPAPSAGPRPYTPPVRVQ
ncbi:hypothetical protein ASG54_09350 [Aureimonas sp. Leaf460]|nr:hypothetical protein ASG62_06755 [Aureimonas sp. Leaf427]KQT79230.1 hypothetical protein ASG54_09350 [Aureimonas sp. Leaf460]